MSNRYPDVLYTAFSEYVSNHTGIRYSPDMYYQLDNRISELMQLLGVHSPIEFVNLLKGPQGALPRVLNPILDIATNHETSFFRDGKPFEMLAELVFPELIKQNESSKELSFWSAAVSTGQEAYSLLITFLEKYPLLSQDWKIEMVCTDISEKVLQRTKEGFYTQSEVGRGIDPRLLSRYFDKVGNEGWKAKPHLKSLLNCYAKNLVDSYFGTQIYDLILCRNVLIYQPPEHKEKVINNLFHALKPGGFLLLGAGETLLGVSNKFLSKKSGAGVLYQKPKADAATQAS